MIRELPELREDAAGLSRALARDRYRRAAGLSAEETLREMLAAHPLAASAEGLAQASEALAEAETEEPKRPARIARLSALRDFLLRARAEALEPAAAEDLWGLPARPLVRPPGDAGLHGALPAIAVERELSILRSRERRAEMERALAAALQPADAARGAVWDAAQEALGDLPPFALHARGWTTQGSPEVAAERVLQGTDAVMSDLGGWLLQRHSEAGGGAERHDVLHLLHAPRCASAFPRGEMMRTVRRWTEMLRLEFGAKIDDEVRPLKMSGACAEAIDPPYEARVSLWPEEGPRALSSLLGALSVAELRLGPPEDAPPEDLWLSDPAVPWACRALFAGLLREPDFARRCAKADLSRDDERAIAIAAVIDARLAAARTLSSLKAHELGLGARAEQFHRDAFRRATGAELPAGLALRELDPWLGSFAELRGRSFAARARFFLREQYDQDWWRNPRALPAVRGLWARGGRPTLVELWAEIGGEPSVEPLLEDLAEACR